MGKAERKIVFVIRSKSELRWVIQMPEIDYEFHLFAFLLPTLKINK